MSTMSFDTGLTYLIDVDNEISSIQSYINHVCIPLMDGLVVSKSYSQY